MFSRLFGRCCFGCLSTACFNTLNGSFSVCADSNNSNKINKTNKIWRIVFTGGPCAGKSTALSTTRDFLTDLGYQVYIIEESATFLNRGNVKWSYETLPYSQYAITKLQTHFEDIYYKFAEQMLEIDNKPSVILIDRGIMDGKAYIDDEAFIETLKFSGHDVKTKKDFDIIYNRYDMVLHLVSAAKGAPQYFKNEEYRLESIRDAIIIDDKLLSVWNDHQDRRILYNETTFNDKIKKIISNICDKINIPNLSREPLKFVINIKNEKTGKIITDIKEIINELNKSLMVEIDAYFIQKAYINKKDDEQYTFLRKTVKLDYKNEDNKDKLFEHDPVQTATYTLIQRHEYLGQKLSESTSLDKKRYSDHLKLIGKQNQIELISLRFEWKGVFYALEIVKYPESKRGTIVLKLFGRPDKEYCDENGLPFNVPKSILVQKNVTGDYKYNSVSLAT